LGRCGTASKWSARTTSFPRTSPRACPALPRRTAVR
jgi:hypothetical protein